MNFKRLFIFLFYLASIVVCQRETGDWSDIKIEGKNVENPHSTADADLQLGQVVRWAVKKLKSRDNSGRTFTIQKILSARKQVVLGVNYEVLLLIGRTNCMNNPSLHHDLSSCFIEKTEECKLLINHVPWLNTTDLLEHHCRNFQSSSSLFGGVNDMNDAYKEELVGLLKFVEGYFNLRSSGFYVTSVEKVLSTNKQLVAGTLYKLKVQVKLNCLHDEQQHHCLHKHEIATCSIDISSKPWLSPATTVNNFKCENFTALTNDNNNNDNNNDKQNTKLYFYSKNDQEVDVDRLMKMDTQHAFNLFKSKYNRRYDTVEEEEKRLQIFQDNIKLMKFYQSHDAGSAVYGASPFSDLTEKEFREKYLSKEWKLNTAEDTSSSSSLISGQVDPPPLFDWREHGAVTPVKNQGMCGSCWAFSVTGNIEGQWFIKKKKLLSLSEQQLVDCDKLDEGCNGGLPSLAYLEIMRMGGLESEKDYPYSGKDGPCKLDVSKQVIYINSSLNISKDEREMQAWLFKNGPLSIGINAMFMQFYLGGISHPWHLLCPAVLDHGVLIVGYAVKKGFFRDTPYWIVKNSWGERWGEKGYYLVYRGDGTCGLNELVSSAVVL